MYSSRSLLNAPGMAVEDNILELRSSHVSDEGQVPLHPGSCEIRQVLQELCANVLMSKVHSFVRHIVITNSSLKIGHLNLCRYSGT